MGLPRGAWGWRVAKKVLIPNRSRRCDAWSTVSPQASRIRNRNSGLDLMKCKKFSRNSRSSSVKLDRHRRSAAPSVGLRFVVPFYQCAQSGKCEYFLSTLTLIKTELADFAPGNMVEEAEQDDGYRFPGTRPGTRVTIVEHPSSEGSETGEIERLLTLVEVLKEESSQNLYRTKQLLEDTERDLLSFCREDSAESNQGIALTIPGRHDAERQGVSSDMFDKSRKMSVRD